MRSAAKGDFQTSLSAYLPLGLRSWRWMPRSDLPHRSSLSRYIVFDVDATRQAAAPSCIPLRSDASSCTTPPGRPSVRRVTSGASGGRWYEHVPQRAERHTRQWIGTYGDRGNGDYQGELASARHSIKTALFALRSQSRGGTGRVSMDNTVMRL